MNFNRKRKVDVDKTLVDYIADVLIDHLHGVTVVGTNRNAGQIIVKSYSADYAHEITIRRLR